MNAAKNTGVPESSVLGSTDMHEEKSTDSMIQCICMLRRNGASERSRVSETRDDYSTARAVSDWSRTTVKRSADDASSCCCGEQNAVDQWVRNVSDWTGSGVAHNSSVLK